jgi:osmotically inducible lipoprotein OsmB
MTNTLKESMMNTRTMILAFCLVGSLAGCSNMSTTEQRTLSGGAIGTASGALIAGLTKGNPLTGALIGAAVGTAGGYLYDQHEKSEGN